VKDDYRYTDTLFKRSPLVNPETSEGFAAKVRAVVADHARQLQGTMSRAQKAKGRYQQGLAGKKRTTLPGGILVETWINPFGLAPTLMARVVFPKVGEEEEILEIPVIDHGWATGPYDATVIYTWTSLAAVLIEQGYSLDGTGAYVSTVTRTESQTVLYPEEYSGLTRLLVQAFVGSGRDITEIIPSGWSTAGTSLGLVRSPAGVYWLCNVGNGIGLKMSRLDVPEAMAPVAAKVQSGVYPAALAKLAEATVLGALTLASPEDTVTVLLHTELPFSDVYAASQVQQHWGWCWRYQMRGADDEHDCGAVVLTRRFQAYTAGGNPYGRTLKFMEWVLDITFTDGRPNATLEKTLDSYVQPTNMLGDRVFFISKSSTNNVLRTFIYNTSTWNLVEPVGNTEDHGVLASCYGYDGAIDHLEVVGRYIDEVEIYGTPDSLNYCGSTYTAQDTTLGEKNYPTFAFAGETIDGSERIGYIDKVDNYSVSCNDDDETIVNGYGTHSEVSNTKGIDVVVGGPGLVFFIGPTQNYTLDRQWTLSWSYAVCLCDWSVYNVSARHAIDEARHEGELISTSTENDPPLDLVVCVHDRHTTKSNTSASYIYLTDFLATASTAQNGTRTKAYDTLAISYHGELDIVGDLYPAGMDADGAEIDGRFCGGV
jgi:hypothetical protein